MDKKPEVLAYIYTPRQADFSRVKLYCLLYIIPIGLNLCLVCVIRTHNFHLLIGCLQYTFPVQ